MDRVPGQLSAGDADAGMAESGRDRSLRLALIVVDPRTYRAAFAADFEREVIQVVPLDLVAVAGPPPAAPVVLVWLPPDHPVDELAHIARWRGSAALIGCAPTGSSADSERALAAGFDDFVAGRASTRELAGRIRALTRRVRPAIHASFGGADFQSRRTTPSVP